MGGIAFVFSGQGDQYPGMGMELCKTREAAAAVFRMCEALRAGTMEQCFSGTGAELEQTENTQPCLFAMELAAAAVLQERGIVPDAVAGFSLGEMTAATVAGCFDRETGFRLVCQRGALMQAASERYETSMAAVLKLTAGQVEELCRRYPQVYPVNYNCPGNVTVSGLTAQIGAFCADVKAAGGRAVPLKVRGAFHSPFMHEAAAAFAGELEKAEIRRSGIPLYSNVTAQPYGDDAAQLLARQIESPVQWERLVRNLAASGVDTFVEIGPGKTLTNMIKRIVPGVRACGFGEYLEELPC